MTCVGYRADLPLEGLDLRALSEPARTQRAHDCFNLLLANEGTHERNRWARDNHVRDVRHDSVKTLPSKG